MLKSILQENIYTSEILFTYFNDPRIGMWFINDENQFSFLSLADNTMHIFQF